MSGFPFCGFLIDTQTLDIRMDHHRMLAGRTSPAPSIGANIDTDSSNRAVLCAEVKSEERISFRRLVKPSIGKQESCCLCTSRPFSRCLADEKLDTVHNELETVHLNVFVNFAMTAMKIPHYFQNDISPRQAESISRQSLSPTRSIVSS